MQTRGKWEFDAEEDTLCVGADALIGPQENGLPFRNIPANSYPRTKGR